MARPIKAGLDYFLSDVDFWDEGKIMDLTNEYGPIGVCVYDVILRQVYRNGYYLEISPDTLAARVIRIIGNRWIENKSRVLEVIDYCAEIGLFDKALLSQSIITSVGIQQRYAQVSARNKVDKSKYWLLEESAPSTASPDPETITVTETEVSATETGISATETPVSVGHIPQRREEKKREEKKREEESVCERPAACGIALPCRDGQYVVTQDFYDRLTHTYPDMEVEKSLEKLSKYLALHPSKQGAVSSVVSYAELWVSEDNLSGKYRRQPTKASYDLFDYESTSVLDELDEAEMTAIMQEVGASFPSG